MERIHPRVPRSNMLGYADTFKCRGSTRRRVWSSRPVSLYLENLARSLFLYRPRELLARAISRTARDARHASQVYSHPRLATSTTDLRILEGMGSWIPAMCTTRGIPCFPSRRLTSSAPRPRSSSAIPAERRTHSSVPLRSIALVIVWLCAARDVLFAVYTRCSLYFAGLSSRVSARNERWSVRGATAARSSPREPRDERLLLDQEGVIPWI
jgi:hypothetical protein